MIENQKIIVQGDLIIIDEDQEHRIHGKCDSFIPENEIHERAISRYELKSEEHLNWQPISHFLRNKQYQKQNARTPQTLKKCLHFVITQYLQKQLKSLMKKQKASERQGLLGFVYDRVKAIRQQYYVQKIFNPKETLKIFKITLMLETLLNFQISLVGSDQFLIEEYRDFLLNNFRDQYVEALKYTILLCNKNAIISLVSEHQIILNTEELVKTLEMRRKMESGNYWKYLIELSKNKDTIMKFILWMRIEEFRDIIEKVITVAKMKVKKEWLCKVMGFQRQQGWIELHKEKEGLLSLNKQKKIMDIPILSWVSKDSLFEEFTILKNS